MSGYQRFRDVTGEPMRQPEPFVIVSRPDPAGYLREVAERAQVTGPLPEGEISARRWREMSPELRRLAERACEEVAKVFTGRWMRCPTCDGRGTVVVADTLRECRSCHGEAGWDGEDEDSLRADVDAVPLRCELDVDDGQRACQAQLIGPTGRYLYEGDDDAGARCPRDGRHTGDAGHEPVGKGGRT